MPASQVVKNRLALAQPRRNLPWDDQGRSIAINIAARYLGEHFASIDDAMRLFLKGQVSQVIPQAFVEVTQTLESTEPADTDTVSALVRPFEHVYGASADPQTARML